jgi:hypothetical protein
MPGALRGQRPRRGGSGKAVGFGAKGETSPLLPETPVTFAMLNAA